MNRLYTSVLILFTVIELIQTFKLSNKRKEDEKYESIIRELEIKIAGGYPAVPGQYPFFVGLVIERKPGSSFICSGSLITDELVLTAAHCAEQPIKEISLAATHIASNYWIPNNVKIYKNKKVCISPKYQTTPNETVYFDYAVIRLNEPVKFSKYVQPIWLPEAPIDPDIEAFALGTGVVKEDTFAKSLNVLPVKKVNCDTRDDEFPTNICFRYSRSENHGDTCGGDSGGPIVGEVDGKLRVFGLTSYGSGPCLIGQNGTSVNADVYRLIDPVLDIIRECMS